MCKISVYGYEGTNEMRNCNGNWLWGCPFSVSGIFQTVRACMSNLKRSVSVADRHSLTRSR